MNARPAAVLFDMDGTLTDSEPLWDVVIAEVMAEHGGVLTEDQRLSLVGSNVAATVRLIRETTGTDACDEVIAAALLGRISELFAAEVPLRPGALELLESVRGAGIATALVTSTHRAPAEQALRTLGRHWFDVVVAGDEVDHLKPHPQPYLTAAQLLGVDPGHCVAIEDSVPGVESAVAAGCVVVAVPSQVILPSSECYTTFDSLFMLDVENLTNVYLAFHSSDSD